MHDVIDGLKKSYIIISDDDLGKLGLAGPGALNRNPQLPSKVNDHGYAWLCTANEHIS